MKHTIIKPVITEKSITLANGGKFTFIVDLKATKHDIKRAVEETFSVNVRNVLTSVIKGKTKRVGKKRTEETITSAKKALVMLEKDQKIDLFELAG